MALWRTKRSVTGKTLPNMRHFAGLFSRTKGGEYLRARAVMRYLGNGLREKFME